MAGFADVLLRGLLLVEGSLVLGGIAWLRLVLRAGAGMKPDAAARRALRMVAAASALAAVTQATVLGLALAAVTEPGGAWPLGAFLETGFAGTALARVALAAATAALAVILARQARGHVTWLLFTLGGAALVGSSALLSHAVARVEHRAVLVGVDAAHQMAAAVWIGGLAHLALWASGSLSSISPAREIVVRFSSLALGAMAVIVSAGVALTAAYVAEPAALVGTAYGVMVLSKVVVLAAILGLAAANFLAVRRAAPGLRLSRFVEVELGLGITVLFAAASLTSLPPAVDVGHDRATPAEVGARFVPTVPRLVSPAHDDLVRQADALLAPTTERKAIERAWSEYNHHWAGGFVLLMAVGAALERLGVRAGRHWPLLFVGLGAFMFVRNDPRAWPLGPTGFWESMTLPDVLQHRVFVVLVVVFGLFEWMVRTGRLTRRPWAYVFPLLCGAGGALLLTHSHAMFNLKQEFLVEVTHAPLAIFGAFAGWARWLELRLPESARASGWTWIACLAAVALLLLGYREG